MVGMSKLERKRGLFLSHRVCARALLNRDDACNSVCILVLRVDPYANPNKEARNNSGKEGLVDPLL